MKFDIKIAKLQDIKTEAIVEWSKEKKLGEIKIKFENGKRILLVGIGADNLSVAEMQKIAAKIGKRLKDEEIKSVSLEAMDHVNELITGLILGEYEFKKYKTQKNNDGSHFAKASWDKQLEIIIVAKNANEIVKIRQEIEEAKIYCQATNFARDLVNEPSSLTTPSYLANLALKMAKTHNFSVKVYSEKEIEKMGMGGLLGVGKGSDEEAKFLELRYGPPTPKATARRSKGIILIGKGITFDSGGLSLKKQDGMETMKMDMAGAASILAIFSVLEKLKVKANVVGLVPLTENMPSGKAIKPGDIIKIYNGKTVEVLNTDAEGRLILADALSYGVTLNPDLMIDLATLTGACIVALGEEIAGVFSTDKKLEEKLLAAGGKTGEKIWPMPLEKSYEEALKSDIADLKNVGKKGSAGAITAALFLKEFVGNVSWAHLDIAGPAWEEKGTALTPKGGTGFGVRTILNLLKNI